MNSRDNRGNAPLHIAAHFGFDDVCYILLKYGADPTYKNGGGFTAYQEAIAGGHTNVALRLHFAVQYKTSEQVRARAAALHEALEQLPDFTMEIDWEFKSWVPLVSRFCPSDTYRIAKRGSTIRMDFTLVGMEGISWVRADASLFFTGREHPRPGEIVTVNRTNRTVSWMSDEFMYYDPEALKTEVGLALHEPIQRNNTDPNEISFIAATTWLGAEKTERVGQYQCKVFNLVNCKIESITRTESEHTMSKGSFPMRQAKTQEQDLSFDHYFDPAFVPVGKGSGMIWPTEQVKRKSKLYSGRVWMSKAFPFTLTQFLPIVQTLSPTSKHFSRLTSFLEAKLPDYGFPVCVDLPVFPTIAAKVCFKNLDTNPSLDPALFDTNFEGQTVIGSQLNPEFKMAPYLSSRKTS